MTKPIYKILLRLYPWDYMTAFATEMLNTFQEASEEKRRRGWGSFLGFLLSEFSSLMAGVGAEWIAKLTADVSVRGRHLPDLRMMRPSKISQELWFAAESPIRLRVFDECPPLNDRTIAQVLCNRPLHLINGYGPTEATTFTTTYEITEIAEAHCLYLWDDG